MDELETYAELLGRDRPEVQDLLLRARLFPKERERYLRFLRDLCLQEGRDILNPPVFRDYDGPWPLPEDFYTTHVLKVATTKAGKSHSTYGEICSLIERGVRVIIFDPQNEYIDLGLTFAGRVLVAWPDLLRIGLLQPSGDEGPEDVAIRLSINARESFFFRDMSENLFFQAVVETLKSKQDPTVHDLMQSLASKAKNPRERNYGAMETILNRLNRLVTEMPGTFSAPKGLPAEFFLQNSVVFPLKGISSYLANFLINHIIQMVMRHKTFSDSLDILFVLEECQNYINRQREARLDLGEVFIYSAMRMARKLGLGFQLLSQTLSTFSPAILANANTVFVGRLLNGT